MNDAAPAIVFTLFFSALCSLVSCTKGQEQGIHAHQVEAVKAGHGEWVVNPDGTTIFRWLETAKTNHEQKQK